MTTIAVSLLPFYSVGQQFTNAGMPLNGGKIYTYLAGTTTPVTTYPDSSGDSGSPNANPIVLNAYGRLTQEVWVPTGTTIKTVLKDAAGNTLETKDYLSALGSTSGGGGGGGSTSNDWINIVDYGADPTGGSDSTTAILNAIIAASDARTFIYIPNGTFKIASTITNTAGPYCMGIQGNAQQYSILDGSTLSTTAVHFTDSPDGSRFNNFQIKGPGQSSGVTSSGLYLDVSVNTNIALLDVSNLIIRNIPTYGFYQQATIVSSFINIDCVSIGDAAFYTDHKLIGASSGTSSVWLNCYANDVKGYGYYFTGHNYSTLNGCAADVCYDSYYFNACTGFSMIGCGNESNVYVDASLPGRGIVMNGCGGMTVSGHWCYDLPNVASVALQLISTFNSTFLSVTDSFNRATPTYDIKLDSGSARNMILNPSAPSRTNSVASVSNGSGSSLVQNGNNFPAITKVTSTTGAAELDIAANTTSGVGDASLYLSTTGTSSANYTGWRFLADHTSNNLYVYTGVAGSFTQTMSLNDNGHLVILNTADATSGQLSFGTGGGAAGQGAITYNGATGAYVLSGTNATLKIPGGLGVNGNSPASQVTGWGTPTGSAVISNYSGAAATLVQTSNAVAKIIETLKSVGIFAA